MSAFTKGPWVARQEYSNRWRIEAPREGYIPVSVALVTTTVLEVGKDSDDTPHNANLIAAAPDMYEALEKAEALFQKGLLNATPEEIEEVRDLRMAALAKARGE